MSCVFTNAARCSASWARDWWALSPPKTPLRYVAMAIWLYSAIRGLQLAWEHTMLQLHPSPFQTCDFAARFPTWLPLDKWLPQVFVASGDCSVRQWQFLSLEMPQWLVGIFAAYLLVAILVIVAQPFKAKKKKKTRSVWSLSRGKSSPQ
ncbi:Periplasmic thiol:disulfide oxidoreductase DsbB,required for DsbA reoxidation [Klebsiella pneumoniae ISC21]|nr:Periplasmic thiol:disulfide oxidoreductase DsbB,required for DsbA reoxidation [Klebsiella pneumoniae ISC21]